MFAFKLWADWLKSKAAEVSDERLTCTYRDTIGIPECALNPAFSIEVWSPERMGRLSFWRGGTCDYEVLLISTGDYVANEAGLVANDATVEVLVARYLSLFR